MQNLISVISDKCTGCGACVRACPAPEANFYTTSEDGRTVVAVNDDKCIVCGKCLHECPHDARDFEDDTTKFFKDITNKRVVVIVSPAIRAAFPDKWVEMLKWLKQEGVFALYDMALGGDICSWVSLRAVEQNKMKYAISSHCPAIVNYITNYRHDLMSDLSPVYTPAGCMAVYLRTYLKINYSIALLSSCPAGKTDLDDGSSLIEYNVTFKRFEEELLRRKVNLGRGSDPNATYQFEDEPGALGTLLIRPSGLRDSLWAQESEINLSSAAGKDAYDYITEFGSSPKHAHPVIMDCISCSAGCAEGPGMDWDVSHFAVQDVLHQQELDARGRRKLAIGGADKQFKKFDEIFNLKSFMRSYKERGGVRNEITPEALNAAYLKLGKVDDKAKAFNCGACGCATCRDMAEKIALGCDIPENCIIYARSSGTGGDGSSVTEKVGKMTMVAEKVSSYANHLLADIENIYASLYKIDDANHQSQSRSSIVRDILSKIIGFCNSCESIDQDNLPILVSTLEKLQAAMDSLNSLIDDSVTNSTTIREAMKEVADATTELNVMVTEMINPAAAEA